jgi:hypothetical protein
MPKEKNISTPFSCRSKAMPDPGMMESIKKMPPRYRGLRHNRRLKKKKKGWFYKNSPKPSVYPFVALVSHLPPL